MRTKTFLICVLVCMLSIVSSDMNAFAAVTGVVTDETVITLIWENNRIDAGFSLWDEYSVRISTEDAGLGNGKIYDFAGVKTSLPVGRENDGMEEPAAFCSSRRVILTLMCHS